MGQMWDRFWDIFFPRRCAFCGRVWAEDLPCPDCQRELPWLRERAAESKTEFVRLCVSALGYQGVVRRSVLRMKFARRQSYLPTFGRLTAQCARDHLTGEFDLVSWVPLSAKSLRARGFDQAELLAEYVAADFDTKAVRLLRKKDRVGRQSAIRDEARRRANVLGAFSMLEGVEVAGRRILLVDDVCTTGATLSECARILRTAGCQSVVAVTLASAKREGRRRGEAVTDGGAAMRPAVGG